MDLELFTPLAESIDRHVSPDIHHTVVVPRSEMAHFEKFASLRRSIHAQEDFIPLRLLKSPAFLKHLQRFRASFRRPFYVTSRGKVLRGWMLQQFLKIEMTRRSTADAVLHVDSDVVFVRSLQPEDAFRDGKATFFRVEGTTSNSMHRSWLKSSCEFLGIPNVPDHKAHYVENCVLWDSDVTRSMVKQAVKVHGKPFIEVLLDASTMSEYYIYGLFADTFPDQAPLAAEVVSYCNSFWPEQIDSPPDTDVFLNRLDPKHVAIAIQSTVPFDIADRLELYTTIEASVADR